MDKGLVDEILGCQKCPLYQNAEISPLAPEINTSGHGVLCIIGGPVSYENDYTQEVVTGVDRVGLMNILNEYTSGWSITRLIKCQPSTKSKTYNKKIIQSCKSWIVKEVAALKPDLIIGFGKDVEEILGNTHEHPPWAKPDVYLPSLHNTLSNSGYRDNLIGILTNDYR